MIITSAKLTFISSPYRASTREQRRTFDEYLISCINDSLDRNEAPYPPHYYLPDFLDDSIPKQRELGIAIANKFLVACRLLASYIDFGISEGMQNELDLAKSLKIRIEIRKIL